MPLTDSELRDQAADHNCQDPGCENLYDLVIFRTRDGDANWLCWMHAFAFLTGVLEGIAAAAQAATQPAAGDAEVTPPDPAEILARYGAAPVTPDPGA